MEMRGGGGEEKGKDTKIRRGKKRHYLPIKEEAFDDSMLASKAE